jgi:transposase
MPIDAVLDDVDALRALVNQLSSERDAAIAESRRLTEQNDQLRHLLKQLQRAQFGQRSERLDRDQMQLALEDIETLLASRDAEEEEHQNGEADKPAVQREKRRTNRGALPAHLPHVHVTLEPESTVCPCCHGAMHVIGEENSQRLDKIPAQYQVTGFMPTLERVKAGALLTVNDLLMFNGSLMLARQIDGPHLTTEEVTQARVLLIELRKAVIK